MKVMSMPTPIETNDPLRREDSHSTIFSDDSDDDIPPLESGAALSDKESEERLNKVEEKVDGLATALTGIQSMLTQLLNQGK